MLNKIIEFSVKNKLIIALFTLGLILLGIYETTKLPIDAQPDITNNQVQVITVAPSYGAADIERLVTFPIEQATSNISGITELRSFSRFGLSLVTIVFNDNTDVYWARQQVQERLQIVQENIPEGIGKPELGPISSGLGEIFQYVVRAKKGYENIYDETELRTIQDWVIRRQLLGTKGVADVSSFGGKLKQYEIAINPNKLQAFDININDVFNALEKNNQNTGGAYIEKKETVLFIRSEGLLGSTEDIGNIQVSNTREGIPVHIKDVANVKIGYATRYGAMTYNDTGEVSGAIVLMLKGENANEVIGNIKQRLEKIQETLPEGIVIEPFLDRAKMVNNTISTVKTNLMEGALIVVFILVLFLGNFRAGLLVASVIPLAMLFAIIMMNLFGVGGNLMSLGALDFGLIVDGAVIIVEAVLHQLAHKKHFGKDNLLSQKEMDGQVSDSATKMVNSAVFGQIIILIVYLPIFTLQGIEGKMFKPMAQTVAFALIGAFLLSLTYIPMMSSLILSRKKKTKDTISDKIMTRVENGHQKLLMKALKYRKTIILSVLILFAGAVFTLSRMGGEFIPSLEEGDFAVEMRILQGSNINETKKATTQAASILLKQFPEVQKVVTKIGSAEIPTEPMPMDAGDMIIVLKPKKEWTSATSFPELSEKMSKALQVIPGLTTGFQFPVQMRFNELMTGARQDVVCKIYGENLDSLAIYAKKLGGIINTVKGAQDLYLEPVVGAPQMVIGYNRAELSRYNISVMEINRVINMAFAGQTAGALYEGERKFDVVVRMDNEHKKDITSIQNLLVPTATGEQIPLHQLATIELKSSPNQIQREDTKRRIVVGFNVRGRDVQSIVEELQQKADKDLKLPSGYTISYGGAFENLNEAKARLGVAVPISLVMIFLLLFFAFGSVKHSLLIYTAIPLSAIGGIYFLALRGMPFSISAGVGFIALFGVAVLNGIVLISEFNRLKKNGITNTSRIVLMGTRIRLRPVLMTAFVASLGFLPMALSNGAGAEVQRPLATVVIGGLMLATLLTLFVLPILYVLFERINKNKMKFSKKNNYKKLTVILFLISFGSLSAQENITYDQALDKAFQQNGTFKNSKLISTYQEKLKASYLDIPQLEVMGGLGQIQGEETDNSISVSQRFSFPTVYSKRKQMLDAEWMSSVMNQQLTKTQLTKEVSEVFYRIIVLQEKKKVLEYISQLYNNFADKASLRLKKGEANILEESTAEIQREQATIQLNILENDLNVARLQLQVLLQSDQPYQPIAEQPVLGVHLQASEDLIRQHPQLQFLNQQIKVNEAEAQWQQSKLLPDLLIGYTNQSMKNINNNRFSSVQIGVGIPLFTKGQRALAKATKAKVTIAENEYQRKEIELKNRYGQLVGTYVNQLKIIENYDHKQLPKSETILKTAQKQMEAGEIDYLNWVILTNQAVKIKVDYIENIEKLNQIGTELNFLISK
ncbi:acriflavine resistance protein B [Chryseobacterium piperi]|uniref:Acriflavine resistance protein B n=1 Tax=Chryseobacterium piperi TaxID=558152 RepID=A0A086BCM9_9FLAO|nr:CusA/CzcA family heavy metal efflux RND transporter [Chryseobacterium piperi]ASW73551.1 CusA/CzcA family heavy metal efflux RND transporter [Chryseobacterium piperi]KFF26693.1 acriflavine resistance protein B [Chryseobacterium piperi]